MLDSGAKTIFFYSPNEEEVLYEKGVINCTKERARGRYFLKKNCNKKLMLRFVTRSISQKPYFSDEKKKFHSNLFFFKWLLNLNLI